MIRQIISKAAVCLLVAFSAVAETPGQIDAKTNTSIFTGLWEGNMIDQIVGIGHDGRAVNLYTVQIRDDTSASTTIAGVGTESCGPGLVSGRMLTWDTGNQKGNNPLNGQHVEYRVIQRFTVAPDGRSAILTKRLIATAPQAMVVEGSARMQKIK